MKAHLIFGVLLFLFSCKSDYKLLNKNRDTLEVDIRGYELYQFTMYRDLASDGDKLLHPEFTAVPKTNSTAHEILYILRDPLSNKVIYLTTTSHKYLYRNRGAFNDPIYKQNLIFNDLDYIYFGKESQVMSAGKTNRVSKFSFYNPTGRSYAHNLHVYFTETSNEIIIDSVTNDYALERDRIKKPLVYINEDVFSFKIKFEKVKKAFSYLPRTEENIRSKLPKSVDAILIQGTNVFLKLAGFDNNQGSPFFRDRVRYFEPY